MDSGADMENGCSVICVAVETIGERAPGEDAALLKGGVCIYWKKALYVISVTHTRSIPPLDCKWKPVSFL